MRFILVLLALTSLSCFAVEIKPVVLKGNAGGTMDGALWNSASLMGKNHVIFYVDPDEEDLNIRAEKALAKAKFPENLITSIAIVNMAASWLPNFSINMILTKKQKKYPCTLYVRDYNKRLVNLWGFEDDNYNIVVTDKKMNVVWSGVGKLTDWEVGDLIKTIQELIATE